MTQLASLPNLSVQIAFNPTNLQSLTQTWTDVTVYVRDFQTNSGRQHFLDRIEASTLRMTFDNRSGYFLNQPTSTVGAIIRTRLPIKVTATISGTTYPVFYGFIESIEEQTADQLNQDLLVSATDSTKFLSLTYLSKPQFWSQFARSASAVAWYRCNNTQNFTDIIGNHSGQIYGTVQNTTGVLLYDTDTAIDLTNGGNNSNTAWVNATVATATGSSTAFSADFWIIGQNISNVNFFIATNGTQTFTMYVDNQGKLNINTPGGSSVSTTVINDGNWHHIGVYAGAVVGSNYPYYLWVDGTSYSIGNVPATSTAWTSFSIGAFAAPSFQAYIDEVIISGATSTMASELANRYRAGNLMRTVCASGDRIAETLLLAGYGSLTAGVISVPNYTVNDVAWSSTNNGAFFVQNIQNPVTNSTALDIIQQVTDTDIGAFFQNPDGTFEFDTQAYLYSAANNVTPSGAYLWTDQDGSNVTFYEPTSLQILRDDADLWTTVQITAQNGTVQTYENTTAEPVYAYSTLTKNNVISVTNEQAMQSAIYLGNLYQSPLPRVQNVSLSSKVNNGANLAQMLSHYLNDGIQFVRNQNGASSAGKINSTMVIESVSHQFNAEPGEWVSSFTFDPYPKRFQNSSPPAFFLLFDDTTYGKFDSTNAFL